MRKNEKINKFWNWFKENQHKYLFLNEIDPVESEKLFDELLSQLHKYNRNLFVEIGGHPKNDKLDLAITADGIIKHFSKVEELVDAAPELKDWRILKFRQPVGPGFKIEYEGKEFDPEKVIFIPLNNPDYPDSIGLQVCYPDYTEEERDVFVNGTFIMLDTLLGEKSAVTDIEYLEVTVTPSNISNYDFRHLCDIGEYIEERKEE